jgi:hypothetical protein
MPDNKEISDNTGSGVRAATDEVSYSGNTADVQLMRPVLVTGAEGSKTVIDLPGDATNGFDVDVTRVKPDGTNIMPSMDAASRPGWTRLSDGTNALIGQETMADSVPVVIASDQSAVPTKGSVAHDADASAIQPILVGGFSSATAPTDVSADTEAVRAWFLRNGAQAMVITAAGALIGGDATNGLDVDVTRVKPDGTNTMPSLDSAARAGFIKITDGSLTGGLVDETGSGAVDTQAVGGGTPHDSADSGNPVKIGFKAIAHSSSPTAVAAGDRTDAYANRHGIQWVIGGHPNIQTVRLQFTAAQTDVAVITVSSGTKIVVTSIQVTLDNASTVFPLVRIGFGSANTPTTSQVLAAHGGVPAGGGFSRGDGSGILGIGGDGDDLRITTVGTATGNGMEVVVTYYTIES